VKKYCSAFNFCGVFTIRVIILEKLFQVPDKNTAYSVNISLKITTFEKFKRGITPKI
jgi:hypothetical protein